MQHSNVIGGSSAERRIFCPPSKRLESRMPPGEPSVAAQEGTACHSAIEFYLTSDQLPVSTRPLTVEKDGFSWRAYDDVGGECAADEWAEMRSLWDLVGLTFEGIEITEDLVERKLGPALDAFHELPLTEVIYEETMYLTPKVYGTADILGATEDPALKIVGDWKFGRGRVAAKESYQMAFYALGALTTPDKEVRRLFEGAERIMFAVIQPANAPGPVLDTWITDVAWLERYRAVLFDALGKQDDLHAPPVPGRWCRWCRAKPACPAYFDMAEEAEKIDPVGLTETDLAYVLPLADRLEDWIAAVRRLADAQSREGVQIPGHKRVAKRPRRSWTNEYDAKTKLVQLGAKDPYTRKLWSPAQAERTLGKKVVQDKLSELIVSESSGTVLVPTSDPRPPVDVRQDLGTLLRMMKG